jgi:NAD(P)-dependent dehydrogenase (short-subunit alcohol dehydrogenase family)
MGKLEGKVALVTGGTSGIGLATAKEFVNEGAFVFITGRRESELAAAVKEIGRHVTGVQGDLSNLERVDRRQQRILGEQCVQRHEGGRAVVCTDLDDGLEGSPHPRKRGESGLD